MSDAPPLLFSGEFRHSLDAKNRLTVPARWRFPGDEQEALLMLPHPDGYLLVLPPADVQKLLEKRRAVAHGDTRAQLFWDKLFSQSLLFGCDKQGRVQLTERMIAHLGLQKEAVLVGSGTVYKIYHPARWDPPAGGGEDLRAVMREVGF